MNLEITKTIMIVVPVIIIIWFLFVSVRQLLSGVWTRETREVRHPFSLPQTKPLYSSSWDFIAWHMVIGSINSLICVVICITVQASFHLAMFMVTGFCSRSGITIQTFFTAIVIVVIVAIIAGINDRRKT